MTRICLSCAEPAARVYHAACLERLFGTTQPPSLDVDLARVHTIALSMVGKTSLSGAQRKLSLRHDAQKETLQVSVEGARFILKPQSATFPHLPENEWVAQRLAALSGLVVPPAALLPLTDDTLAYVVQRFDRSPSGSKHRMEDFCQLAERPPREKYDGSAELCARIVKRFAAAPGVDLLGLFRLLLFCWWTGNGDLHLKNVALLADAEGDFHLSPVYDQLNTRLVIPDDPLALPIQGKRSRLRRATFLAFADQVGLGPKAARRALEEQAHRLESARAIIAASPLPDPMQHEWVALLEIRSGQLLENSRRPG